MIFKYPLVIKKPEKSLKKNYIVLYRIQKNGSGIKIIFTKCLLFAQQIRC